MLSISTAASKTALTILSTVKTELKITDRSDDAWLSNQIDAASAIAINYLGIEEAEDGTRNIGVETIVETQDRRGGWPWSTSISPLPVQSTKGDLVLGRRPVVSITSITEDGTLVDPVDYLLHAAVGKLRRLSNTLPIAWPSSLIVITYQAGWKLPGETGRNLPQDIENAVIALVKAQWYARRRDPAIKSENIPGVMQTDYFFGTPGQSNGGLPQEFCAGLDPYRNIHL